MSEIVEISGSGVNAGGSGFNGGDPTSSLAVVAPLSSTELEEEEVEVHKTRVVTYSRTASQLYTAAITGDWERARVLISSEGNAMAEPITQVSEIIMHVAVGQQNLKFIKELLKSITKEQFEQKDHFGTTALCSAAIAGNTDAAKLLVKADPALPCILRNREYSPLHYAAEYGHHKTVQYLDCNCSKGLKSYKKVFSML